MSALESVESGEPKPTKVIVPGRILFSGLTASGKTTHSKLLARSLDRPWFDATTLLKKMAGLADISNDRLWVTEAVGLMIEARKGDFLDRRLDQELLARTRATPNAVTDAWAMPWLWEGEATRVWVHADLDTRVRRCMRSPTSDVLSAAKAEKIIVEKDNYTRDLFQRLYEFDLFEDHDDFDVILDTSDRGGDQVPTDTIATAARYAIATASESVSLART